MHLDVIDVLPPLRKAHAAISQSTINVFNNIGKLYPNPANRNVIFSFIHDEDKSIELKFYDTYGKQHSEYILVGNELTIPLFDFSSSVYQLQVFVNGIAKENHKLVVIK